jgi:hypothetical protein
MALLVSALAPAPAAGDPTPRSCKLLKLAKVERVLGAPATVADDAGLSVAAGADSCGYDVAPGLGEPGGALVVVTHYRGPLADGIAAEFGPRAEKLGGGVVWDPTSAIAYVVKKGKVVGVSISYTSNDPPAIEVQPQAAKLAKAAARRA